MGRYSLENWGEEITEHDEFYIMACKNFRDPVGPPLGAARPTTVSVGVTKRLIKKAMTSRNTYLVGRIFGILPVEMPRITSAHRGVKRPMRVEQDDEADGKIFVVVMHPTKDCYAEITEEAVQLRETDEIKRQVFVALLSENRKRDKYPSVDYWLEHCNWIDCDPDAPQFPDDYMHRYEKACIWTG